MPTDPHPIVAEFTKDWKRKRLQKSRKRGGVEARIILAHAMYWGEHQSLHAQDAILSRAFRKDADKNKLRLVFEMIQREVDRKIGRLWSIAHEYHAAPNVTDPAAFDKAEVIGQLIRATDFKLEQSMKRWLIYFHQLLGGVVCEHVDWKIGSSHDILPVYDDTTGELLWQDTLTGEELPESGVTQLVQDQQVNPDRFRPLEDVQPIGDIGGDVIDPLRFFIDASVPRVSALGPDQSCEIAEIVTRGYIEQTFGTEIAETITWKRADLTIVETKLEDRGAPVAGLNLKDMLPHIQGSRGPDDPEMCVMITRYQPPHRGYGHGRRTFYVPDDALIDDGEIPYPEVPIIDFHWRPPATTFWTKDFVTRMIAPQKFLNKRFSQLGEASNAQVYALRLLGPGLKKKDVPTDMPGDVEDGLNENGAPNVGYLQPPNLPSFFPDSIRMVSEFIEQLGSADLLSQRKFPGELRGSLAIPMLQEILDSEDGPFYAHMGECFAREKQMRINRIKQFYPASRTMHYVGENQKQEVLILHTDDLLRAGIDYSITVDEGTLVPELSSMRWARVKEAMTGPLAGLYANPRTGQIDYSKVAHDLKFDDRGRLSRESQYRKLARQIVGQVRSGKLIAMVPDPMAVQQAQQQGQPPPLPTVIDIERGRQFQVYPFWDHNVMMDEYEAVMATMEFQEESSELTQQTFLVLYELSRTILQKLADAKSKAVQQSQIDNAVAMATQQAAAHAASITVERSLDQVLAQGEAAQGPPDITTRLRAEMAGAGGDGSDRGRAFDSQTVTRRPPPPTQ
jgi:hypothetical protein